MGQQFVLGIAGVAAAVLAVGIDLQLFDRYSTEVVEGDLRSRPYPEMTAIGAVGPVVALAVLATLAGMLAPAGERGRTIGAACQALLAAGVVALVVGVATAALMRFSTEARPLVIGLAGAAFVSVYALEVRSLRSERSGGHVPLPPGPDQ